MWLSEGVGGVQVATPLACGPGWPELSQSYTDMASKTLTFTSTNAPHLCSPVLSAHDCARGSSWCRGVSLRNCQ